MLFKQEPAKTPTQKFLRFIGPAFIVLVTIALTIYSLNDPERQDMNDVARKNAPGKIINLPSGKTHYQIAGPDSAQTVMLVHGFSIPQYIWDGTYQALISEGFRVVRYDHYGRGFSDRPKTIYTKEVFRNQLSELITTLDLQGPIHLIGLSFGGAVVSDFALSFPDKVGKITFIDPIYEFPELPVPKSFVGLYYGMLGINSANDILNGLKYPENHPDWVARYQDQMRYRGFRNALVSTLFDYDADISANYSSLGKLKKQIQLFWGADDTVVEYALSDSVASMLQTKVITIPDAGHLPHLEKPGEVHPKLIKFLKN